MSIREWLAFIAIMTMLGIVSFAGGSAAAMIGGKHSVGQLTERVLHVKVSDDSFLFDCRTMGNRKCGSGTRYTFVGFQ